jgi:hypothetical protein
MEGHHAMQISFATRAGSTSKPSEDFVTASPDVAIVLDGLTAPASLGTGCVHGTPWYVAQLGGQLLSGIAAGPDRPLQDLVADALGNVAGMHAKNCDLTHPGTPSSSIAMLRFRADVIDHLVLFDSVILLDGPSGLRIATDHRVDDYAQVEHEAVLKFPLGTPEHQDGIARLVAAQRHHRNVTGGYWVAGARPEAAYEAITGQTPRSEVTRAALLSDGASCLVDKYGAADWAELLKILEEQGPNEVLSRVRALEDTDPLGECWPRYKRSDDATAVSCLL